MTGPRLLSSEEFAFRDRFFWAGVVFYGLGSLGGLVTDGFPRWSFPVFFDFYNLGALVVAVALLGVPGWTKTKAATLMIFTGALTFPATLVVDLVLGTNSVDLSAYSNLFVVSLFLGPGVFLGGKWSPVAFGSMLLLMLAVSVAFGPAPLVQQHLWFEVPGVVGVCYLLYRYRVSLDKVLADLQRSLTENRLYRERERLAALGELTAGISHEIKNPLNFVVNFAESSVGLLDEYETANDEDRAYLLKELRANLVEIQAQGQRGVTIVQNMLLHARSGPHDVETLDINLVVAECLRLSWLSHRGQGRSSVRQRFVGGPAPVYVRGNRGDLSRAFVNLCSNAFWSVAAQAKKAGPGYVGEVVVEVSTMGNDVWIVVRDNGVGFDAKTKAQLFVPFFTTKGPGEGTGLGLSLTREVVEAHHGRLDADGEAHRGAAFTVVLPTTGGPTP